MEQMIVQKTIKILIAEQDRIYRDGLAMLIEQTPDFELVAKVDTVIDAVKFCHRLEPDVIILDNHCTHLPTTHALKEIQSITTKTQVLIFSRQAQLSDILRCLEIGVRAYLSKGQDAHELAQAIRLVASGNMVIDKDLCADLQQKLTCASSFQNHQNLPQLTHRENQIVALLAQGLKNNAIAQHCNIAEKTVRNHVSNIFAKLQVSSRAEVMRYLQQHTV